MPAVQFSLPSFKMSDRSLFAVLLRSPWWISFAVAAAVGFACYSLFPGALRRRRRSVRPAVRGDRRDGRVAAMASAQPGQNRRHIADTGLAAGRDFVTALERAYVADGYGDPLQRQRSGLDHQQRLAQLRRQPSTLEGGQSWR